MELSGVIFYLFIYLHEKVKEYSLNTPVHPVLNEPPPFNKLEVNRLIFKASTANRFFV